jgi:hypothetical protein
MNSDYRITRSVKTAHAERILLAEYEAVKAEFDKCRRAPANAAEWDHICDRCAAALQRLNSFVRNGEIPADVAAKVAQSESEPFHLSVDDMERYHLGKIRESQEVAVIEEHLLWCQNCLDHMEAVEHFIDMVRAGLVSGGFYRDVV